MPYSPGAMRATGGHAHSLGHTQAEDQTISFPRKGTLLSHFSTQFHVPDVSHPPAGLMKTRLHQHSRHLVSCAQPPS